MMHQKLLEITKECTYNNSKVCAVINIGSVVFEFFNAYEKFEPDALSCKEQLGPLLTNLNKGKLIIKIIFT